MTEKDPVLLAIAVLNHNDGGPFVKEAIKRGLAGGIISPATGLIGSPLLNLLSIRHDRRDMVLMFEKESKLMPVLESLVERFKMDLPNHGVIFVLKTRFGLRREHFLSENNWNESDQPYQLVLSACKHGKASDLVEKLNHVTSVGATIFTGKGEHQIEKQQMMGLSFSPQKDMVLSIVESDLVPDIFEKLETCYECSQTKGMFVYSLDVDQFSQMKNPDCGIKDGYKHMLFSIVSEELEENYIEIMKKHQMNGGTSLKGHGSISKEMMERIFNITVNPQKKIIITVDFSEKINQAYQDILQDPDLNVIALQYIRHLPHHHHDDSSD